ncbi:hypothetical protein [Almyronema epifaneia]|uniref:AbrB/MazE/SpoVT family DNA-binding domain-containing protein n=1 Tax=Almyronema epifaneia S1 TaxID=2991925 RepID=A0ABW6IKQ4_9CYAN
MKVRGIKRGNTIELIDQTINIPDGTEVMLIIEEQSAVSPEEYLEGLQILFAEPTSDDFIEAMKRVEHERQLSYELAQLNLRLQTSADDTPLTELIGSAPGSFATPEEADQFIRQERDAWDY